MRVTKLVMAGLTATMVASILSACNKDDTEPAKVEKLVADEPTEAKVEVAQDPIPTGNLLAFIEPPKEGVKSTFLVLNNATAKDIELQLNSAKKFDYIVYDKDNKPIYTWSEDKLFTQAKEKLVIKAGEEYKMDLELKESFTLIPPGKYTIEAFPTAKEAEHIKAKIDYYWIGTPETGIPNTEETEHQETVELVGYADSHTIEVISYKGEHFALQIGESAKEDIANVKEGEKFQAYYIDNGTTKELRVVETYKD